MNASANLKLAENVLLAMAKREPNVPGEMYSINWFCRTLRPSVTADEINYVVQVFATWNVGKTFKTVEGDNDPNFGVTMSLTGLDKARSIAASRTLLSKITSDRFQKVLNIGAFLVSLLSFAVAALALSRTTP